MADTPENPEPSPPSIFPFITRMLMDEDEDMSDGSFFRQYPDDHPALLTVQRPFAEILSDVANTACGCGQATGQLGGPEGLGLPPPPRQQNPPRVANEEHARAAAALPPADGCDRQHGALLSTLFGGHHDRNETDQEADLIKLVFLKGMEEANKFLPTTTTDSLLIGTSTSSGCAEKMKKHGKNKRRNDEDGSMVPNTNSRNTKLMVLQVSMPEQHADGEMVAQIIINEFNVCIADLKRPRSHITVGGAGASKAKQPAAHNHLHTLLIHCARAVGTDDRVSAAKLLAQIKAQSSPRGDPNQRLVSRPRPAPCCALPSPEKMSSG